MKAFQLLAAAVLSPFLLAQSNHPGQEGSTHGLVTYSNRPIGSPTLPLLLRTFMPDPGLGDEVLMRHQRSAKSPKYNASEGKDVSGFYRPIAGLPAAIGVSYGSGFSYCWDTVECRLMYAWQDGFLDMQSYWGDPERGSRQAYGYVPHLVGTTFYQASGKDPLLVNGKSVSDFADPPEFTGYQIIEDGFLLMYQVDGASLRCEITKGPDPYSLAIRYRAEGQTILAYQENVPNHEAEAVSENELFVTIQGKKIAEFQGRPQTDLLADGLSVVSGKRIFNAMACGTCHSLDGSASHGPSLLGLYGKTQKIDGLDQPLIVDDAYILESIKDPNEKIVSGYPENYMPPYTLKEKEYQALLLYLKSVTP